MRVEQVVGRFMDERGLPIEGVISFIPQKIWLEDEDGTAWPTLTHEIRLVNGGFVVYLTRTDTGELPWFYRVRCPVGIWHVQIAESGPIKLKDLLPNRFA